MASLQDVVDGQTIDAADIMGLIDMHKGTAGAGNIPHAVTAVNDATNFAGDFKNADATNGRALRAQDSSGTSRLEVSGGLPKADPDATGLQTLVTAQHSQTLLNKTLSSGTKITVGSDATGDTYYRNSSGELTRLAVGSSGQVLTVASGLPSWQAAASTTSILLRDVALAASSNSSVADTLFTGSIPGGTFSSNQGIRICAVGDWLNNSGSTATTIFTVTLGGQTLFTKQAAIAANASRLPILIDGEVFAAGTTASQWSRVQLRAADAGAAGSPPSGTAGVANHTLMVHNALTLAESSAHTLTVTAQHSVSHADLSARLAWLFVEKLS